MYCSGLNSNHYHVEACLRYLILHSEYGAIIFVIIEALTVLAVSRASWQLLDYYRTTWESYYLVAELLGPRMLTFQLL